ncbi:hypothetical protein Tco_1412847 [Tanacetum coccineum]
MCMFLSFVGLSYKLEEPLFNSGSASVRGENESAYEKASFFKLHGAVNAERISDYAWYMHDSGEVFKVSGEWKAEGTKAYVAQSPWIQSVMIEDNNILFGREMDRARSMVKRSWPVNPSVSASSPALNQSGMIPIQPGYYDGFC